MSHLAPAWDIQEVSRMKMFTLRERRKQPYPGSCPPSPPENDGPSYAFTLDLSSLQVGAGLLFPTSFFVLH